MFSAFQTFGRLGAGARAVAAAWTPSALWPTGTEPGMWISPSTLPASFNDSTGTTPVATPGSVADSANPVGLALDIRAGATALSDPGNHMLQSTSAARPLESARVNLLTYTEDFGNAVWASVTYGTASLTKTPNYTTAPDGSSTACRVLISDVDDAAWLQNAAYTTPDAVPITRTVWMKSNTASSYVVTLRPGNLGGKVTVTPTWTEFELTLTTAPAVGFNVGLRFADGTATACDISIWHPQTEIGTTATPYQSVPGNGSTYSATGITPFQLYDGVDDGMATASFAAGTLINGMDCMIPVRRDSAASTILGLASQAVDALSYFGACIPDSEPSAKECGTPTVWVDNVQLAGGTAVTRGTLNTALTAGDWHILEYRNLDLSAWTALYFARAYTGFYFNGARGDIMLFPSTASTADKDAARQYLADYYGVTLP